LTLDEIVGLIENEREDFAQLREHLKLVDDRYTGVLDYVIRSLADLQHAIKGGA